MKMTDRFGRRPNRRGGAMLVLVAVVVVVFLIMAVMSVDVAYMQLVRTELRASADASARAAAEALSREQDPDAAVQAAIDTADRNTVAGKALTLTPDDVVLGRSVPDKEGRWIFEAGSTPFNAVQVNAFKSDTTAAGSVPLFLGAILGVDRFEPIQSATATQLDREICLVMDRSGSMAWDLSSEEWSYPPGIPPYPTAYCTPPHATLSRWAAASAAVAVFITELQSAEVDQRISLVSYAAPYSGCSATYKKSQVDQNLTTDFSLVSSAMSSLGSKPICGGTSISGGIDEGRSVLTGKKARPYADKTMIVLTDGQHNYGPSPVVSAIAANDKGITIHTITFSDQADQVQMQAVAEAAGGNHYHAPDAESLKAIFLEIARSLPVVLTD